METPETQTTISEKSVVSFLTSEHASRRLPHWAHISAVTTGRGRVTFSIYGHDLRGGWLNCEGASLDEAQALWESKATPQGLATEKRRQAEQLLREAAALETEVVK